MGGVGLGLSGWSVGLLVGVSELFIFFSLSCLYYCLLLSRLSSCYLFLIIFSLLVVYYAI